MRRVGLARADRRNTIDRRSAGSGHSSLFRCTMRSKLHESCRERRVDRTRMAAGAVARAAEEEEAAWAAEARVEAGVAVEAAAVAWSID